MTYRPAGGQEVIIRTQAVQAESGKKYFIQVAASLAPTNQTLRNLLGVLALALLLATAIAVTGGFFLIRSSLKPLDNMAVRAQKITSRSLHERMPISNTGDELQQLSISLNRMIERLEEAFHHISRFDFSELVRTTVEYMRLLADEKKLALKVEAAEPVYVEGDPSRLQQVVVNLLDNAIKYTPEGGSVSVTVRAETDKAVLTVTDTGIRISEEGHAHLFERFYRTEKARWRQMGCTGLGLSIRKG